MQTISPFQQGPCCYGNSQNGGFGQLMGELTQLLSEMFNYNNNCPCEQPPGQLNPWFNNQDQDQDQDCCCCDEQPQPEACSAPAPQASVAIAAAAAPAPPPPPPVQQSGCG